MRLTMFWSIMVDKGSVPVLNMYQVTHDLYHSRDFWPESRDRHLPPLSDLNRTPTLPCTVLPTQQPDIISRVHERSYKSHSHSPIGDSGEPRPVSPGSHNSWRRSGTDLNQNPGCHRPCITGRYHPDRSRYSTMSNSIITKPLTLTAKEGADKPTISAGRNGSASPDQQQIRYT